SIPALSARSPGRPLSRRWLGGGTAHRHRWYRRRRAPTQPLPRALVRVCEALGSRLGTGVSGVLSERVGIRSLRPGRCAYPTRPTILLSRLGRSPEELQTSYTKPLEANENRVARACQEVRKVPTITWASGMRQLESLSPSPKGWPLRALRDAYK